MSGGGGPGEVVLALAGPASDLAVLAQRAARHDATCPVRLVASGEVVAAFVPTAFDCLGMRSLRLRAPAHLDVVVEAVGLAARALSAQDALAVPPPLPPLTWTHALPPQSGWTIEGTMPQADVASRVAADTEEFRRRAAAAPGSGGGGAAVAEAIAQDLWGRPLAGDHPARLAHAASYLGFLGEEPGRGTGDEPRLDGEDEPVVLRSSGRWRRLDTRLGVTLTRASDPLGLLLL
jgi:2-hydroxychromene-2-carboxylate isomerase